MACYHSPSCASTSSVTASPSAPELIVTSPYVRAVQTAQIAADVLGLDREGLRVSDDLLPDRDPAAFLERLRELGCEVMCVGHAPHLNRLVAAALGVGERELTALSKAGAACLEFEEGGRSPARLVWLLPARTLRRLADHH
jgi:phosphohistidine phosphatase